MADFNFQPLSLIFFCVHPAMKDVSAQLRWSVKLAGGPHRPPLTFQGALMSENTIWP